MPINEANRRKVREQWPLHFDLEGVPQQKSERERIMRQQQTLSNEDPRMSPNPQNRFTVDDPIGQELDINNPKTKRYVHQEFPRVVYHHETGHVLEVADEKQLKAAQRRGFKLEPAADRDYSNLKGSQAQPATAGAQSVPELSAEELAELEEAEEEEEDES